MSTTTTTETKTYGAAVIGCGLMGTRWGEEINRIERLRLLKMADAIPKKAREAAQRCGASVSAASVDEIASDPNIDLVVIAARADQHHALSMRMLRAGKHVLCEKPYSMNLSEIDQAIERVGASGRKLRIGFMMRFLPALSDLARRIHEGALGWPIYFRHYLHQGGPGNFGYFDSLIRAAGSPTADCGIHYIDLFHWFAGERITEVYAIGARTEQTSGGEPNLSLATFKTAGGSAGWVEDCWTEVSTGKAQMECLGPNGSIEFFWEPEGVRLMIKTRGQTEPQRVRWPASRKPLIEEMHQFIHEMDEDADVRAHLHDVRHATEVALAANRSMKSGEIVRL